MSSGAADDSADFSLVLGGPLYQLLLRGRLLRPPLAHAKSGEAAVRDYDALVKAARAKRIRVAKTE